MRNVSFVIFALFASFLLVGKAFAMSSESYAIPWDATGAGGDDVSSSTNFGLRDTIDGVAVGSSSSSQFSLQSGYRVGDRDVPYMQFSLFSQDPSTFSQYTTFNTVQNFVVVANPSLFHTGDMVEAIENVGINQKVAIGKVSSVVGSHVYVDRWDGDTGIMNISPTGVSDLYRMQSGVSVNLGSLQGSVYASALTATRVSTSAPNGYSIYMKASGSLNSGLHGIYDVTDGIVTPGQEEYGWRLSGATATTGTARDMSFTTATIPIQQNTVATTGEGICVEYKLSVTSATPVGSYSQTVTYSATANY
jgi:hypothetical protein